MQTLIDLLREVAQRHAGLPAVALFEGKTASWGWTYAELWDAARRVAAYLRAQGIGRGDRVVLWGPNRPEWVAAFFGVQLAGGVVVPLDLRSPEDLLTRIEEQTTPTHLFLGNEQAKGLKEQHAPATRLEDLREATGGLAPAEPEDGIGPGDTAELVFTSGTTGNPKGVILTHANIVANIGMVQHMILPTPKNQVLSILPLSHMFEQMCGLFVPISGGAAIFYVSTLRPDAIFDAMTRARITNMSCVPQVLQLFRDGIEREVRKQGKTRRFNLLLKVAARLPLGLRRRLFRQVHARMGGAMEYFASGGAYLDPDLARWWEALGVKVVQGYGMTEAAPVVAAHTLDDRDPGSVGRPLPGVEFKIAGDLEVLVRGANVTPGYWQNDEATAAAFEDGWYKTGDLGEFDANGRLHLRGRKKNMIVLANGMNVYPEDCERALLLEPGVKDAVVLGLQEGGDVEVHAVLVLEKDAGEPGGIVRRANQRLAPHQRVGGHTVWPDDSFPMTPTLKAKRNDIIERLPALRRTPAGAQRE